jgi:hypothetical protein
MQNILSLRSGLTVAFPDITYSRDGFLNVTVYGFTVILGNVIELGAHELHETNPAVYKEVFALACESAEEMSATELADLREHRDWFARQ